MTKQSNSHTEQLEQTLAKANEYTFLVKVSRFFHDDLPIIEDKLAVVPLPEALTQQLVEELQQACDKSNLAVLFEVIDGPNVPLEKIANG